MNLLILAVKQAAVVLSTIEDLALQAAFGHAEGPHPAAVDPALLIQVLGLPFACINDTDQDGNCPTCARTRTGERPSCQQPLHVYQLGPSQKCAWCGLRIEHHIHT